MRLYRLRLRARISGQAPKEVAERMYRDSMVEEVEVFAVWQVYTRCSRSGQQLGSDGVDKGIQSRAPFPGWAAMPEGHNATHVMSILSVICFTKHQRNVSSSLVWWVSISVCRCQSLCKITKKDTEFFHYGFLTAFQEPEHQRTHEESSRTAFPGRTAS
jgi:hypothetical protein